MTDTVLNALKCFVSFNPHVILCYRNYYHLLLNRWGNWSLERLSVWSRDWNPRSPQESRFNNHVKKLWLITYVLLRKWGYCLSTIFFFFLNVVHLNGQLNNRFHNLNFKAHKTCVYLCPCSGAGNQYTFVCFRSLFSPPNLTSQ